MGKRFNAREVADIAVCIEQNGERFFGACADRSENADVAASFRYLARSEHEHVEAFQAMADEFDRGESNEYAGEDGLYFQAMADEAVFTCSLVDEQLACPEMSTEEALDLGVKMVRDEIEMYRGLLGYVSWRDSRVVKRILREENDHLKELEALAAGVPR